MNTEQILHQKIYDLTVQLDNALRFTVPQRLVCALKRLCHQHGANPYQFTLPVPKHVLALDLGIENETLSRNINKLEYYGVNITGKMVSINDPDRAKRTVCGHCAGRDKCPAYRLDRRQ